MSHLYCSLLTLFALLIAFNVQRQTEVSAGPLSLSFARSFRSGREIRTPFKTNQIMVARGFGKRNVLMGPARNGGVGAGGSSTTIPTESAATTTIDGIGDIEKSINFGGNSFVSNMGLNGGMAGSSGSGSSSAALDWLANEIVTNPNFARLIFQRFADFHGGDIKFTAPHETLPIYNAIDSFEYY